MKYVISPVIKIKNENTLELINNSICIINGKKEKILCVELEREDIITIIAYWLDRLLKVVELEINIINKKIEKVTNDIITLWQEAVKPADCISLANCEYQLSIIENKLESKYEYKDELNQQLKQFETIKRKLITISNELKQILNKYDIEIEQDFVLI